MDDSSKILLAKVIAKLKEGHVYELHNCSMCQYPCGWSMVGDQLLYDSGCHCTGMRTGKEARDISDLDKYVDGTYAGHIENFKKFVGDES